MTYALILLAGFAALLAGALARQWRDRRASGSEALTPVSRQHLQLWQGTPLSESSLESAKNEFRHILRHGQASRARNHLRPGLKYVVQVRALAALGTDTAGQVLEDQLDRRLSDDPLEQSWYWLDLATGLRDLKRRQSLPSLLRCGQRAADLPLGHLFAAEAVRFPDFERYLDTPSTPLGRSALRMLHRTLEGLRAGLPVEVFAEAKVGELVSRVCEAKPSRTEPWVARVYAEALRHLRRVDHVDRLLAEGDDRREGYRWQVCCLSKRAKGLAGFLKRSALEMKLTLPGAPANVQRDMLLALLDLRADAVAQLLPLIDDPGFAHRDLAVELLGLSKDARASVTLLRLAGLRGAGHDLVALRALRRHPSSSAEAVLMRASVEGDPNRRAAAFGGLGWWQPYETTAVRAAARRGREDRDPVVRQAADAALARMGEREALDRVRNQLHAGDPSQAHTAIELVASEGLTWLWPDLDGLADAADANVAFHAREVLERLREEMSGGPLG
jgi:hypothetical protein